MPHVGRHKMAAFRGTVCPARGQQPDWARSGSLTGSLTHGAFLAFSMTRDRISRSSSAALLRDDLRRRALCGASSPRPLFSHAPPGVAARLPNHAYFEFCFFFPGFEVSLAAVVFFFSHIDAIFAA